MSFFSGIKAAQRMIFAIIVDARHPSFHCLGPRNTKKAAFVVLAGSPLVLNIHFRGYVSKVVKSVIGSITIDVVNDLVRPFAVNESPGKAMCLKELTRLNADANVTVNKVSNASKDFPGLRIKTKLFA